MSREALEISVGATVLSVAIFFFFYVLGHESRYSSETYPLTASFTSVEGVSVGTGVRMAGVNIGKVQGIYLNPKRFTAEVSFAIAKDIHLPKDSIASIETEGLLGGTYVSIQPGGSLEDLPEGGEIENTQGSISFISLLLKFATGGSGD